MIWLLLVIFIALAIWCTYSTHEALYPSQKIISINRELPTLKTADICTEDGGDFKIWIMEHTNPKGIFLTLHGYHANKLQLIELGADLHKLGYCVIGFDMRGHGERINIPFTFGIKEINDISAILDWMGSQKEFDGVPTACIGWSVGGAIACRAAVEFPKIKMLVLDSTFSRFSSAFHLSMRRKNILFPFPMANIAWLSINMRVGKNVSNLDPANLAKKCDKPMLLIRGMEDKTVPLALSEELYKNWKGPKAQYIENKAAHVKSYSINPTVYSQRVSDFIDKCLKSENP